MPSDQEQKERKEAQESLSRVQNFDVDSLPREKELGDALNFRGVLEPAERLVRLYKQLSVTCLEDFPPPTLQALKEQANTDFSRFDEILKFKPDQASPQGVRNALVDAVRNAYTGAFTRLHPYISYSASKSADFRRLEEQARAAMQGIEDNGAKHVTQLEKMLGEAEKVLEVVRKAAAEQGVSQQAFYFRDASEAHEREASKWIRRVFLFGFFIVLYAVLSVFAHKWPFLAPTSVYENVQLGVSKVLVFAVLSYGLYLAARNFLANKHNAIVNKHRQNALMTYKALVEAGTDAGKRDVVLLQAAACIFGPQSTGFSRDREPGGVTAKSVLELITKPFSPDSG